MHNKCDSGEWTPNSDEVEFLSIYASEQDAIVSIGAYDDVKLWKIGRAAGLSSGTTKDEAQRQLNWASNASKKISYKREIHTHIKGLKKHLEQFRRDGCEPGSLSLADIEKEVDFLIRNGPTDKKIAAMNMKLKLMDIQSPLPSGKEIVDAIFARIGLEKTRIVLEAMAPQFLWMLAEADPAKVQASDLRTLNDASVDFDDRLQKLEARA